MSATAGAVLGAPPVSFPTDHLSCLAPLTCPCLQYASRGLHQSLHDFEEHLEDVGRDWLNPGLLQGPA